MNKKQKAARIKRRALQKKRQVQDKNPLTSGSEGLPNGVGWGLLAFGLLGVVGGMLGVGVEIEQEPPAAPALPAPADELELNPETGAFEPKKEDHY